MSKEADDEHRTDRVSAVFALLTGKLEDAASFAADGQGQHADAELLSYASQITELANEAATIASAVAALLNVRENGPAEQLRPSGSDQTVPKSAMLDTA